MSRLIAAMLLAAMTCGCASTGQVIDSCSAAPMSVPVEYGRPNAIVDSVGWVVGLPAKVAMLDLRADNHKVSPGTVNQVVGFLNPQDTPDILVRVNQYDPIGEWKRLVTNSHMGTGWKLTTGLVQTTKYTVLPGRIFGADWYNPFTNTLNLYSDIPAIGLARAAVAKDMHQRVYPGSYATTQVLPFANMWSETIATRNVLRYVSTTGSPAQVDDAYRVLLPSYVGKLGSGVGAVVPFTGPYAGVAGAMVGHVANGIRKQYFMNGS